MVQPPNEPPEGVKNGDETKARTMLFVGTPTFALGESDYQISAHILNIERDEIVWSVLIAEPAAKFMDPLELGIVNLDSTS